MASKAAETTSNLDELDNFFLDGDLEDDPFASPKGDKAGSGTNKRKEPGDGLGLDEEVSVAKKARVPRIKLDQDRYVLSPYYNTILYIDPDQINVTKGHTSVETTSQGLKNQRKRSRGKNWPISTARTGVTTHQMYLVGRRITSPILLSRVA